MPPGYFLYFARMTHYLEKSGSTTRLDNEDKYLSDNDILTDKQTINQSNPTINTDPLQ